MYEPVVNHDGSSVDLEAALHYMDADILKAALIAHPFDNLQAFFDEYCKLHQAKFGKPFAFEE